MTISIWKPVNNVVSDITNANPGVVTTASSHGYSDGMFVNFYFPPPNGIFGMTELLGQPYSSNVNSYVITVLSPTTFSINQDTTNFTPFTVGTTLQQPQVIPNGEVASTLANAEQNLLPPI